MRWSSWLIVPALVVLTLLVYSRARNFEFTVFDDNQYVTQNDYVKGGLTAENIRWAFTEFYAANWHPLTWVSLQLDAEMSRTPGAKVYHTTNILLHLGCVLLLYFWLYEYTGNAWPAGFVAAIFAVHPLHVESVAWIAERKDVLSGFFGFAAFWAYGRYVLRRDWKWYALAFVAITCSLLAKQMLVTFPFALLLLDYWPLKRTKWLQPEKNDASESTDAETNPPSRTVSIGWLILEKVPFFALTVVMSVAVFLAQRQAGAMQSMEKYSLRARVINALVAYVVYLKKMFWPNDLAVIYPHPGESLTVAQGAMAAGLLLAITAVCVWYIRRRPYLFVGWCWYLGTLVPVIGLVQVGVQQLADRFMYIPMVGLLMAIAWTGWSFSAGRGKPLVAAAAVILVLAATVTGGIQVSYWANSIVLMTRAVEVNDNNPLAWNNLGSAYWVRHIDDQALAAYEKAMQLQPDNAAAVQNVGRAYYRLRRFDEAERLLKQAIELNPKLPSIYANLAGVYSEQGRTELAMETFRKALEEDPKDFSIHHDMGVIYSELGDLEQAEKHFRAAQSLFPRNPEPSAVLASVLVRRGKNEEALQFGETTLKNLPPGRRNLSDAQAAAYYTAVNAMAMAAAATDDLERAQFYFGEQINFAPRLADPHANLAVVLYEQQGDVAELDRHARQALDLEPRNALVRARLGWIAARQGKTSEAAELFGDAVRLYISSEADPTNHLLRRPPNFDSNVEKLLEETKQAAAAKPDDVPTQYLYGNLLAYLGQDSAAQQQLQKTLELDPDLSGAERSLRIVRQRLE